MRDRQGVRLAGQAMLWCIVLWVVNQSFYLAPMLTTRGIDRLTALYFVGCAALGVIFCFSIFLGQWKARGLPKAPRVAAAIGSTLASLIGHTITDSMLFMAMMGPGSPGGAKPGFVSDWDLVLLTNFTSLAAVHVIFACAVALTLASIQAEERERTLAAARAAAQEAQLAALRFQINPHFLFNALNAVTSLVGAGRNPEAVAVVSRLSSFFRASLSAPAGAMLPLQEELDVVGSYLEIEAARFGERLAVEIDAPEALYPALIPHFLLQPLVENAVKHGVAASKRRVTVRVSAYADGRSLVLTVRDDGAAVTPAAPGAGIGLANVAARLETLFGADGRLTTQPMTPGFEAQVRLPLMFEDARRAA
ncbi:histidine kinase [Phenylobacterium sp.]|uniref:sensor histidine kinase n=1 Tax=Phenylobacterium sp. TaxID=1871053 RepID=UPI0028117EB5|nr:histidine kinase [Phenylobacterium sp.]